MFHKRKQFKSNSLVRKWSIWYCWFSLGFDWWHWLLPVSSICSGAGGQSSGLCRWALSVHGTAAAMFGPQGPPYRQWALVPGPAVSRPPTEGTGMNTNTKFIPLKNINIQYYFDATRKNVNTIKMFLLKYFSVFYLIITNYLIYFFLRIKYKFLDFISFWRPHEGFMSRSQFGNQKINQ